MNITPNVYPLENIKVLQLGHTLLRLSEYTLAYSFAGACVIKHFTVVIHSVT